MDLMDFEQSLAEVLPYPVPYYMGKPFTAERFKQKRGDNGFKFMPELFFICDILDMEKPELNFDKLRKEMKDIGNGIFKKKITDGYGDQVVTNSTVTVHFTLFFKTDQDFSNSTQFTSKPFSFVPGKGNITGVLPGFELAIMSMKNQEVAHFVVPHKLLYGKKGLETKVPADQDGYLIAEVIRVTEIFNETTRINLGCNITQTMSKVEEMREKAKAAFDAKFYQVAADKYFEAIRLLVNLIAQNDVDNKKRLVVLVKLYLYAGMAYNKNNQPRIALEMMGRGVELEDDLELSAQFRGKLYMHTARSLGLCGYFQRAFGLMQKAREILGDQHTKEDFKILFEASKKDKADTADRESVIIQKTCGGDDRKGKNICISSFQRLILSFVNSNEKSRIMYAFMCDQNQDVKTIAAKFKTVHLKVEKIDSGLTRYIFTKK